MCTINGMTFRVPPCIYKKFCISFLASYGACRKKRTNKLCLLFLLWSPVFTSWTLTYMRYA